MIFKKDITDAAGSLQPGSQEIGAEAAIHAMQDIFANEDAEAVLLTDAEYAFNYINRKVMLHNLNYFRLIIATYVTNCYITPTRLFIIGGAEILSKQDATPGVPTATGVYALGFLPLIHFLSEFISVNRLSAKEVVFANNFTVAGPKFGYFSKASKSYLIIK